MRAAADQTPDMTPRPRARVTLAPNLPPRGLSSAEAAAYIGVGQTKFFELMRDGLMPKRVRIGGRSVWDRRKLDEAFDALAGNTQADDGDPWEKLAL